MKIFGKNTRSKYQKVNKWDFEFLLLTSAIKSKIPESIENAVWKVYYNPSFWLKLVCEIRKLQFICEGKKSFQSKRAMFLSCHEHFCLDLLNGY